MNAPADGARFTDVRRIDETGSTNDDLMELGRQGEPEGIVLVAGHQTVGRGRHGRRWSAPPGAGLLCSVLLRPPAAVADLVTATVAVALEGALVSLGVTGVGIKWPNDLIVADAADERPADPAPGDLAGRKLAGILAEVDVPTGSSAASGPRIPSGSERLLVVVGAGVNVHTPDTLPVEIADRFVALDALVTPVPGVDDLLTAYLASLEAAYAGLLADRQALLEQWRDRCVTIGRDVRVDLGARDLEGRATGIDDRGRLVVRTTAGDEVAVTAGDVVHLVGEIPADGPEPVPGRSGVSPTVSG